jgi:release factor glutamine methyltransferase
MFTVLEAIQLSTDYLAKKGVESPRTNAELLLADILSCKRLDLYMRFDQPVSEVEKNQYREFIARRGKREPLQYILGNVEFYGLNFIVNKDVLIPRQETEILIDQVLNSINGQTNLNLLDIGTGSGNIPISILKNCDSIFAKSIDISQEALNTSKKNIELHNLSERLTTENIDLFDDSRINELGLFDIIVSNPPYVAKSEYETIQPEILEFEPAQAVTDYDDGYKFYRRIAEVGNKLLNENGKVFLEVGIHQAEMVKELFSNDYNNVNVVKDYLDIDRVIIAEKK